MTKGIIYVMSSVTAGLIKIGKTQTDRFRQRIMKLEKDGYSNITGLKCQFAIELEDYSRKEQLLWKIFDKSRVQKTELFALDIDDVIELLKSFEGTVKYPEDNTNKTVKKVKNKETNRKSSFKKNEDYSCIPDGIYTLESKIERWDNRVVKGKMKVKNGVFKVLKGSSVCPICSTSFPISDHLKKMRQRAKIVRNILQEDIIFSSPSYASCFLMGSHYNGWKHWKNAEGKYIDIYRKKQ